MSDFRNYLDYPRNFLTNNNYANTRNVTTNTNVQKSNVRQTSKEEPATNKNSFSDILSDLKNSGSSFDTTI